MATTIRFLSTLFLCLSLLLFGSTGSASAGQVSGWWYGDWNCLIDGRSARMQWRVVEAPDTTCSGDACSSTSAVRWDGRFSDSGSRWVALTNPRKGSRGGVFFRHADGNQWYLAVPAGRTTRGWTTWRGQRYDLSCTKR
jgi:hypothetical protein